MLPKVRRALVKRAEEALQELEAELALMGWRADNARLARVALGMRALTTANASLAAELERLLGLYDKTGDWYQLVVWLRKVVEQEKSA